MVAFSLKLFPCKLSPCFVIVISEVVSTFVPPLSISDLGLSEYSSSGCITSCPFTVAFLSEFKGWGSDVWKRVLNRFPTFTSSPAKVFFQPWRYWITLSNLFLRHKIGLLHNDPEKHSAQILIFDLKVFVLHFLDTCAMNARIVQTMQHKFFMLPE